MTDKAISGDLEVILALMSKLATNWEGGALPSEYQMGLSLGTDASIAYTFRKELGQTANFLSTQVGAITDILTVSKAKIIEAVTELADRDASMADEASIILQALDSLPSAPVAKDATVTPTSTNTSFR